ncbi:MAG TPA: hypothetical protein VNN10_02920 [Dehalococcoidia bacterium]|nr:hypothetical protein [Dehalococcoidia bacterium]
MAEIRREVQETQVKPVAGIWLCRDCGRRIQVLTESEYPKRQPFTCVCGATMEPGEEHATVGEGEQGGSAADP